ncbi:MAG: hypothetical protein J6Y55_08315 [Bacteroidales bacterium]|nr:hypothetical protein [Bacteroidales bacterium]
MIKNTLHSDLLGRLGNGLLKFVVLVVMACNINGVFATTISSDKTYSEKTTIIPTGDVITLNPGVTLTINSEVTIMGNLINNGGTIIVGEGGVLTVNGNVTNTSVSKPKVTTTETTFDPSTAASNPQNGNNKYVVETSINYDLGTISLTDGGQVNVNGNFTNNSAEVTVTTQASDAISRISVKGNFINTTPSVTGNKNIKKTRYTWSKPFLGSYSWRDETVQSNISESLTSKITLTDGYLLVDGNLELQDNSTVTFAGTGIGEDVESTILVRNISGTEGNVTQSGNAVITLNSGAKGSLITQGTYTDKTNPLSDEKHPWNINQTSILGYTTGFNFVVNNNFNLTVNSYAVSTDASASGSGFGDWFVGLFGGGDRVKNLLNNVLTNLETNGVEKVNLSDLIAQVSELLPIELTSFTATATDYGFEFNWVTASENENDYFTLEYSIDGVDFNEIDYVHGAGTTSETSEYEYRWDEAPEFDVIYFRLKQTDYNGEYSYSNVIIASRKKSSGANGTFRYGPLNLQIVDGQLRHIIK